jgi:hypothetical protein
MTEFRRAVRYHNAQWRETQGYPIGTRRNRPGTPPRLVGSRLDLDFARAATPGTHPEFVAMVRELVTERTEGAPRRALGAIPTWDACAVDCCPAPVRRTLA